MKIAIDPGHGGADPGACAFGIREKDINLIVALEVRRLLTAAGHQVLMTREDDRDLSLGERCRIANAGHAEFLVSVHHNAGGGDGYEVIHAVAGGRGKVLADRIASEFRAIGQNPHGGRAVYSRAGSHGDYYAMVRDTRMPAVITEFGFIDRREDVVQFDQGPELAAEARAIADGIIKQVAEEVATAAEKLAGAAAGSPVANVPGVGQPSGPGQAA